MFLGHYFDGGSWEDSRMKGITKFINRFNRWMEIKDGDVSLNLTDFKFKIFKYTDNFKFNKVVSEFMIFYNTNKNKKLNSNTKKELIELLEIYTGN